MVAQIGLRDESSTVDIRCLGTGACLDSTFMIDTPSLTNNADNDILTNMDIPRISVECTGFDSCFLGVLTIIGTTNFELNCSGVYACDELGLTVLSLDDTPSGTVTINCNESRSCLDMIADGITLETVTINCFDGNDVCYNMQVYCPIHPFGLITNDTNNEIYYSYDNINPNTCNLNLNFEGYSTEIYTPYGEVAVSVTGFNIDGTGSAIEVYCEFDWWNQYDYQISTTNQPEGVKCFDKNIIQTQYIDVIKSNPNYIVLSTPHSNEISCNNNDCVMYISQQLITWKSPMIINCPDDNIHGCSVLWYIIYSILSVFIFTRTVYL